MANHKDNPSSIHQVNSLLQRGLILHNDDINTFEFVIHSLMEVCNHQHEQAEQCAMITHFKGKCNVKTGDYQEVKPMQDEMILRGLTASIE
ncbi:MAG: ATP-dependent Clp protease adaptor ClpS [Bacteroidales bacterium]|nr:ATP-dependent Clp protease adaptor ClpS [Bacteroidales bacterium]